MCLNIALCAGDKVCKQDRVPVFMGFTFRWDRQKSYQDHFRREVKKGNKGNKQVPW